MKIKFKNSNRVNRLDTSSITKLSDNELYSILGKYNDTKEKIKTSFDTAAYKNFQ